MKTGAESLFSFSIEEEKLPKKNTILPADMLRLFWKRMGGERKGKKAHRVAKGGAQGVAL